MRKRIRRPPRCGVSLLETATVVTIVSVALSTLSVTWHLLVRLHRRTDQAIEEIRQVERLALRFRLDVREAVAATSVAGEGPSPERGWDLRCRDGRVIEYRQAPQGVERRTTSDKQLKHRDLYRLPDGAEVVFSSPQAENRDRAVLTFHRRADERPAPDSDLRAPSKAWLIVAAPLASAGSVP